MVIIQSFQIKQGEVVRVKFNIGNEGGEGPFAETIYTLIRKGLRFKISRIHWGHEEYMGMYNTQKQTMLWVPHHCCGSNGFGLKDEDRCQACESKEGQLVSYKLAGTTYAPENLPEIISKIDSKCRKLEELLKGL